MDSGRRNLSPLALCSRDRAGPGDHTAGSAHTHFPMLEQPADLASDLTGFVGSLSRAPHQRA
jgi:hypothetical protein